MRSACKTTALDSYLQRQWTLFFKPPIIEKGGQHRRIYAEDFRKVRYLFLNQSTIPRFYKISHNIVENAPGKEWIETSISKNQVHEL